MKWFVATTKPSGELLAARELRKQKYVAYVPKTFPVSDRGHPVPELRCPGYIFVAFADGEHGPVNSTRGVGKLLTDGDNNPEPLPAGIVERLRGFEDIDLEDAWAKKEREDLREGDQVQVDGKDHRCYGERGYFLCMYRKEEAWVLISGKKVPVNIFDLKKVEKPKKDPKPKKKKGKKSKKQPVASLATRP
jgi:hypothetical protein